MSVASFLVLDIFAKERHEREESQNDSRRVEVKRKHLGGKREALYI
jgi:hypothetical protein